MYIDYDLNLCYYHIKGAIYMKRILPIILISILLLTSCTKGNTAITPETHQKTTITEKRTNKVQKSDGKNNPETAQSQEYIGNPNTMVFHYPTCNYLPAENNRVYFENRQKATAWNFRPCQKCNP